MGPRGALEEPPIISFGRLGPPCSTLCVAPDLTTGDNSGQEQEQERLWRQTGGYIQPTAQTIQGTSPLLWDDSNATYTMRWDTYDTTMSRDMEQSCHHRGIRTSLCITFIRYPYVQCWKMWNIVPTPREARLGWLFKCRSSSDAYANAPREKKCCPVRLLILLTLFNLADWESDSLMINIATHSFRWLLFPIYPM